jgi:hypothetical protein
MYKPYNLGWNHRFRISLALTSDEAIRRQRASPSQLRSMHSTVRDSSRKDGTALLLPDMSKQPIVFPISALVKRRIRVEVSAAEYDTRREAGYDAGAYSSRSMTVPRTFNATL